MKVHTTETQQQFKPITLHIEIESQEEFDLLSELLGRNVSVPDSIFPDDRNHASKLGVLMYAILSNMFSK